MRLGDPVDRNVFVVHVEPNPLQKLDDLFTLVRFEAIVIFTRDMNCEFVFSLRVDGLSDTCEVSDVNHALDFFLVDVVDTLLCNNEYALLCPLKHIGLLDDIGEH